MTITSIHATLCVELVIIDCALHQELTGDCLTVFIEDMSKIIRVIIVSRNATYSLYDGGTQQS